MVDAAWIPGLPVSMAIDTQAASTKCRCKSAAKVSDHASSC